MEKTNVIYGASTLWSMKKSKLLNNKIIDFDMPLSILDLSTVDKHEVILPEEIYYEAINYSFKDQMKQLKESIDNNEEIRIWSSHYEVNSYLLFIYMCDCLKNKKCDLYVVYSDEYDKECYSPACMCHNELEKLAKLEHKLTDDEIKKYSREWRDIKETNSDMRILENKKVKSVSFDYYDDVILNKLSLLGETKISILTVKIMAEYHLSDMVIVYLIDKLIQQNKIKIVKESDERYFENIITIVD